MKSHANHRYVDWYELDEKERIMLKIEISASYTKMPSLSRHQRDNAIGHFRAGQTEATVAWHFNFARGAMIRPWNQFWAIERRQIHLVQEGHPLGSHHHPLPSHKSTSASLLLIKPRHLLPGDGSQIKNHTQSPICRCISWPNARPRNRANTAPTGGLTSMDSAPPLDSLKYLVTSLVKKWIWFSTTTPWKEKKSLSERKKEKKWPKLCW